MNYNIGDRIGDYEIVGALGAGGMGKVYKVRNTISDRVEAMKVLLPDLSGVPELADRFLREIKVLAGLDHPNIAALRTAQRIDNQLVMVMELVDGFTLEDRLKTGPIPVAEALDYATQALSALSYAHARGVIHRDIKPANIMVTPEALVKLMDFGIAKAAGDRKLTMTGTTLGSLYYMSPEQIRAGEPDARSDLYSFGVSLYELVTGARPFRGDSDFSIMSAHLEKQPVPPIEVDPKLPPALNEIILMSIAKDPAKRFQSAAAFQSAIQSLGGSRPAPVSVPAAAPASVAAPPKASSSHRGLYMALGATLAVAALVVGALTIPKWLRTRAGESPAPAQQTAPPVTTPQQPALQEPPPAAPVAQEQTAPAKQGATAETPRRAQPAAREPVSVVATPARQPAAANQPVMQPAAQPPAVDQAKATALKEIQKNWPMLASRAGAVSSSLQNLQREQQRQGFGLRGDIAASWKRMEFYMDQLEASISAKDPEAAKEHMDSAEREIATLEKFLGR